MLKADTTCMKGVIFNLLGEVVSREHSPETWDALLDEAGARTLAARARHGSASTCSSPTVRPGSSVCSRASASRTPGTKASREKVS